MYYKTDRRYDYNDQQDFNWDDKDDVMPWRGVTSGGTARAKDEDGWRSLHRQRLVFMSNATATTAETASVLSLSNSSRVYEAKEDAFKPSSFLKQHTDVGFTGHMACVPHSCSFYDHVFRFLNKTSFAQTFTSKYLIDVGGHSFSGRWRAFLQSRSLGLKSTIFREWHDSRLFAWRHYVPVSTSYSELYDLLLYFIGLRKNGVEVERHDFEAYRLASQSRDWARKVLRKEDMEIYLFRLLLEYGRVIDDNRDRIGVVGDGGKEMREFDRKSPAME